MLFVGNEWFGFSSTTLYTLSVHTGLSSSKTLLQRQSLQFWWKVLDIWAHIWDITDISANQINTHPLPCSWSLKCWLAGIVYRSAGDTMSVSSLQSQDCVCVCLQSQDSVCVCFTEPGLCLCPVYRARTVCVCLFTEPGHVHERFGAESRGPWGAVQVY